MNLGKVIPVTAFVISSIGFGVSATGAPASASATPTGSGTLTCSIGGEVSFSPPLTQFGTLPNGPGDNRETAYFSLQLSSCAGPGTNSPPSNPTAATVLGKGSVHLKDEKVPFMGHYMNVMGACGIGNSHRAETSTWRRSGPEDHRSRSHTPSSA